MGSKKSGKVEVVDYHMSLHYRLAHGPLDALLGIYVGEKAAWEGEATTEQVITISRPDLFGGNTKEGGVAGRAFYLPGGSEQVMPEELASRLGLTSATCPAYRGMGSVFFVGGTAAPSITDAFSISSLLGGLAYGASGFLWSSNNPYLKTIWMKGRRRPRGLSTSTAMIGPDANPAHIIYECLTNTDWGQGGAPSGINTASFTAAAQTLYAEQFGLSLTWTKQASIETFVSEILDHIQATLFINPRDGLMTIKLIRADYDPSTLPILDADNCHVTSFSRKAWGETVNEIVVTWTNPENEQEETVAAQNNANIAVQGSIISDSRNYYGVRNAELAQKLAFRDLSASSSPLALFEIEVDRSAWDFVPGGCVRLHYPEYNIDNVVLRISTIDYGKPGNPTVKITAMEDIFAIASADYDIADDSQWQDPAFDPDPAAYARVITTPAFIALRSVGADGGEYPSVYAAALVSQDNDDTSSYNLYGETALPNGQVVAEFIATRPTLGHALLPFAMAAEATTLVPTFGAVVGGPGPLPGGIVIIGDVPETGHEIALIDSVDEDGWVLKRGILDTVPRAWPDGTVAWFVSIDSDITISSTVYSDGEIARFKVTTNTSRGTLPLDQATIIASQLTGRPHLPSRPANVVVGGVGFGSSDLSGTLPASVTATWATRNRLMEDSQILGWTDSSIIPEAEQTTTIKLFSTGGDLLTTHSGLTGTSFEIPAASWAGTSTADVAVYAERDGLESLQGHRIRVRIRPGGWGDGWGDDWGGGPEPDIGEPVEPPPVDPDPGEDFPDPAPWRGYTDQTYIP